MPSASCPLTCLPAELLISVISNLTNRDIKNLRLTNHFFCNTAQLRFSWVFLSANPVNVEVFLAVANHETLRMGITEIIWDDALLTPNPKEHTEPDLDFSSDDDLHDRASPESVPHAGADIEALRHGLCCFPSLQRITIMPAAHGRLYTPLYETPMIRALSLGFNYPLPRGWPCVREWESPPRACPWDDQVLKNRWRGYRLVTRELVRQKKQIPELLVHSHYLNTGLNIRIFEEPCDDYNNLATIIQQPGFTRLQLDLLVGGQEHLGWSSFRSGLMRRALSAANDLEDARFRTDVVQDPDASSQQHAGGSMEHFIPLLNIFPTDKWPRLRHFQLSGFLVQQTDVVSLLASLPPTLRSVELSFLIFLDNGGTYRTLLDEMGDTLGWQDRAANVRPTVSIGVHLGRQCAGRAIWVDKETYDFLYRDDENPFRYGGHIFYPVPKGKGVVRDVFDLAHERPWLHWHDYVRLGYDRPPY
ncbi:hypothetical protein GGR55DRAFT_689337 [Xylaria sp. FL0064]|nr:hypothetical protein GGR55DRAFT_689337 [Xylaria sp. FL0064]